MGDARISAGGRAPVSVEAKADSKKAAKFSILSQHRKSEARNRREGYICP
jgi:hypothetical protein